LDACVGLYGKVETFPGTMPYWLNGFSLRIRFAGLEEAPGRFEIVSDDVDPLLGNNITYFNETIIHYGQSIFYDPVPFEFLKTFATKPQLMVNIDD
jgi:hypothetical protein